MPAWTTPPSSVGKETCSCAAANRVSRKVARSALRTNIQELYSHQRWDFLTGSWVVGGGLRLLSKLGVNGSSGVNRGRAEALKRALQLLKQRRAELAGGEGVEGAEAGGEFGGGEAALAVEAAEKIIGRFFPFLGVAFHAAGDQISGRIAAPARFRRHPVQALFPRMGPAQDG